VIGRRKVNPGSVQVGRVKKVGPEHNPFYWNPNRVGATEAPAWFRAKLKEVDPDALIDVRWNPVAERWGVFYRSWRVNHPICQGWVLLFQVKPRELDERVLARLYMASAQRWGDGRRYFDAIQREIEREQERKEKFLNQDAVDRAMPFWEHSRIRVGYGKSSGSKFSDYHS
jgi:hypothetical protein